MRADKDATLALLTRCRDLAAARIAEHRGPRGPGRVPECGRRACCALAIQEAVTVPLVLRLGQVAVALYLCRRYPAAVEAANRAIRSFPDRPNYYRWLAAALGQLGRTAEAKDALEKAISIAPAAVDSYARGYVGEHHPWLRPEDHAHLLEGLRKAGWGE